MVILPWVIPLVISLKLELKCLLSLYDILNYFYSRRLETIKESKKGYWNFK